jgi:hypothetical protein
MRWCAIFLGCYGFVVGPASAGERWSAETCRHLEEVRAGVLAMKLDAYYTAMWSSPS